MPTKNLIVENSTIREDKLNLSIVFGELIPESNRAKLIIKQPIHKLGAVVPQGFTWSLEPSSENPEAKIQKVSQDVIFIEINKKYTVNYNHTWEHFSGDRALDFEGFIISKQENGGDYVEGYNNKLLRVTQPPEDNFLAEENERLLYVTPVLTHNVIDIHFKSNAQGIKEELEEKYRRFIIGNTIETNFKNRVESNGDVYSFVGIEKEHTNVKEPIDTTSEFFSKERIERGLTYQDKQIYSEFDKTDGYRRINVIYDKQKKTHPTAYANYEDSTQIGIQEDLVRLNHGLYNGMISYKPTISFTVELGRGTGEFLDYSKKPKFYIGDNPERLFLLSTKYISNSKKFEIRWESPDLQEFIKYRNSREINVYMLLDGEITEINSNRRIIEIHENL